MLIAELYPGKYKPTITHSFIRLLYDKKLLLKHFTQNIDCLDREAGVPGSHIVEAHGSFAEQSCIDCKEPYPQNLMQEAVEKKEPPTCLTCQGWVKPQIVFFGEQLPSAFFESRSLPFEADLCIVMGTSLTVQPFASLPNMVPEGVPRVLINKEQAGSLGSRPDDVLLLGDCDSQVRKLAEACGWTDQLETLWQAVGGRSAVEKSSGDDVADAVDKLTKEVEKTLAISEQHQKDTRDLLPSKVEEHLKGTTEDESTEGPKVDNPAKPSEPATPPKAKSQLS